MFTQMLIKALKVGEKIFHILAPSLENVEEYEKLGLEIIKDAQMIKQQIKAAEEAAQNQAASQVVVAAPEENKVVDIPEV